MTPGTAIHVVVRRGIISAETGFVVVQIPRLEPGDKLDQQTFHVRYEAMSPGTRAELIGGIVYMPSPMKNPHGRVQRRVTAWLDEYEAKTPGVQGSDGVTAILSYDSEPQPDSCLYILADYGGQSRINDAEYLEGSPELVVEIASSTESIDLHAKRSDYENAGVCEYVVVALRQERVFWFLLRDGKFVEHQSDDGGVFRSKVFPGLWLDPDALLRLDRDHIRDVLSQGLASAEHAQFVERLSRSSS